MSKTVSTKDGDLEIKGGSGNGAEDLVSDEPQPRRANTVAGEVSFVDHKGRTHVLRPTFEAAMEIEDALGTAVDALRTKFTVAGFQPQLTPTTREYGVILAAGIRAAGESRADATKATRFAWEVGREKLRRPMLDFLWALCVKGDTEVLLADGSISRIDDIVENRRTVRVWAYNESTGALETRPVVDWFKTPADRRDWIILKRPISGARRFGKRSLWVTPEHPVYVADRGYIPAKDVRTGDILLRHQPALTAIARSAIRGMLMGDGSLDKRGQFQLVQGGLQTHGAYVNWVANALNANVQTWARAAAVGDWSVAGAQAWRLRRMIRSEAPDLVNELGGKSGGTKYSDLDEIGLAFWYADDGYLCNLKARDSWTAEFCAVQYDAVRLLAYFKERFGWTAYAYRHSSYADRSGPTGHFIRLSAESSRDFFNRITPYLVPSMRYKVPAQFRDLPFALAEEPWFELLLDEHPVTVCKPTRHQLADAITKWRYDIKVEGLSSFIANGFVVHNCNGGRLREADLEKKAGSSTGSPDAPDETVASLISQMERRTGDTSG